MKKIIALLLLFFSLFALCSCQKEPSLADQIQQQKKEAEEARKKADELKEKERQLQTLVDGLKNQ